MELLSDYRQLIEVVKYNQTATEQWYILVLYQFMFNL